MYKKTTFEGTKLIIVYGCLGRHALDDAFLLFFLFTVTIINEGKARESQGASFAEDIVFI